MKRNFTLFTIFIFSVTLIFNSCKKKENNPETNVTLAVLTTTDAINVSATSITSGGNISNDGGGTISARGVCWSTNPEPTINDSKTTDGNGTGTFASTVNGLTAGKLRYYVRAYATNEAGTAYGNSVRFSTLPNAAGSVTDVEGNTYALVQVGTQVWMAENLKTKHYSNGQKISDQQMTEPVQYVTDNSQWGSMTTGAYCYYDNNPINESEWGPLYNFYAAIDSRNVCPLGFHVPSDAEWKTLEMSLGMSQAEADLNNLRGTDEGNKMKETDTLHWDAPNAEATNSSGFTGIPGGARNYDGSTFDDLGISGAWWTTTAGGSLECWCHYLQHGTSQVGRVSTFRAAGLSIRCIKD